MFFEQPVEMQALGTKIVDVLEHRYAVEGLNRDTFGLVIVEETDGGPRGFSHRGNWRCYPCSLVKAFHLVHALNAIEEGRIPPHDELDRAMRDMIAWSSNTATNYVIDLLTDTTGDTLLARDDLSEWICKREELNLFFQRLDWPELAHCNLTQKLMDDMRYGREAQYAGKDGRNLNALTPLASARLFYELFAGSVPLGPKGRLRAHETLHRERSGPMSEDPHYQVDDFLGGGIPKDVPIWSKAGKNSWTGDAHASYFKHDVIRFHVPGRNPIILVLMTQGKTVCDDKPEIFPQIGRLIFELIEEQRHD
ncbi:serine hydrolase [Cribrihabitans sp. XS_ASV171]